MQRLSSKTMNQRVDQIPVACSTTIRSYLFARPIVYVSGTMLQLCLLRQKPGREIVNKLFGFMAKINRYKILHLILQGV